MRNWILGGALSALLATPALAQSWQEFTYPDDNFIVTFPGTPTITSGTYKAGAVSAPEKIYALKVPGRVFQMEVVDFSGNKVSKADAIKQAVSDWTKDGTVAEDTFARIDNDFGRNLNVLHKDGSRSVGSIYFLNRKLYLIQGVSLKNDPEPQSGQPTRFRESLSFVQGSPAPGGRGGRGGRGGAGGPGGGGRRGDAPAGDGAPPP
jgi:hypothetical protein